MKKSTKAAIFSAFIFPGAGLWWLKHYWRACVFIIPCGLAVIYMFKSLYFVSNIIKERMLDGTMNLDLLDLDNTVAKVSMVAQKIIEEQHFHLEFAQYIIILSWIFSIASSFFAGKKLEQEDNKTQG